MSGRSCPVAASTASTVAKTISATVVRMSQRRRSSRSARAPPTGASRPIGMNAAAATRPVQPGWWVLAVTSTPNATVCIHEPTLETRAADQRRAKFRDRNGRRDAMSTGRGYRAPWRAEAGRVRDRRSSLSRSPGPWWAGPRAIVVLTGAGISTDSGIPDFRGPSGVWTKDPGAEKLATLQTYLADPGVRARAWKNRVESPTWAAKPNAGHAAVARLAAGAACSHVVTQNIDGLHQAAGTDPELMVEIHGTMHEVECMSCGDRGPMSTTLERVRAGEDDPAVPGLWGHPQIGHHQLRPEPGARGHGPRRAGRRRLRPPGGRGVQPGRVTPPPPSFRPLTGTAPASSSSTPRPPPSTTSPTWSSARPSARPPCHRGLTGGPSPAVTRPELGF